MNNLVSVCPANSDSPLYTLYSGTMNLSTKASVSDYDFMELIDNKAINITQTHEITVINMNLILASYFRANLMKVFKGYMLSNCNICIP